MHILGLSSAIESIASSIPVTKLPNQQQFGHLIFDGVSGFTEYALTNDKPFGPSTTGDNSDQIQTLKWINRGDERAFAIYVYKFVKSFLSQGVQLTIVNCISERIGGAHNVNFSFKKNLAKLKYSKQFARGAEQIPFSEPSKNKVKVMPTFHTIVAQGVLSALQTEFPQLLSLVNTPVSPSYISALAQKNGLDKTLVITNNADFYMSEQKNLQICRFYDLSVSSSVSSAVSAAEISVKATTATEALTLLMKKWSLESLFELYLTMSLMKNDFTEDADVRKFVGNEMFNFEKIAKYVREQIDLLKEDETLTEDKLAAAVIEKAYKENDTAIENSKKAFEALTKTNENVDAVDDASLDETAIAQSLLPEFVDKSNASLFVEHVKKGDVESITELLNTLRVAHPVDTLSCTTDTYSSEELWYNVFVKQLEYVLLSNASPFKIDSAYETEKSFDAVNGGKIEKDFVTVRIAQQEKATYLNPGSERVHAIKRDYTAYEVSDKAKSFLKLWIPEDSETTVEQVEEALKEVPAAYQPFVLVLNNLYHLMSARDPKPKVDFVFLNEIIFASLFLNQPLTQVADVATQLDVTSKVYEAEKSRLNYFVHPNYYRLHSYIEFGLTNFYNLSNALGWFGNTFANFSSALLVNGTDAAYLRTLFNKAPTLETLVNAIPESQRAAYTATKNAIKALTNNKEISQHFWLEEGEELLNTRTIYASNIPFNMKASDFYRIFDGIALKKVYLKASATGHSHSGRGTLEFEDEENMKKALVLFSRLKFEDRFLHLTPSAPRTASAAPATTATTSSSDETPATSATPAPATEEPKAQTSTAVEAADGWTTQNAVVRGGRQFKNRVRAGIPTTTTTTTAPSSSAPAPAVAEQQETKSEKKKKGVKSAPQPRGRNASTVELKVDNKWGALLDDNE